jgi:hypothetical protein
MIGHAEAPRFTAITIVGGSIEREIAEVTVRPVRSSPTLTPPAIGRIASRTEKGVEAGECFTAMFMSLLGASPRWSSLYGG